MIDFDFFFFTNAVRYVKSQNLRSTESILYLISERVSSTKIKLKA